MVRRIIVIAMLAIAAVACTSDPDVEAAKALASRVMPEGASKIRFEKVVSDAEAGADSADFFEISQSWGKVVIKGNNANSMAVGLNHYLRYCCNYEFGWFKEDKPASIKLGKVTEPVRRTARVKDRFFLNYCTYGYTMPWWKWEDWSHFIDWMALNGVNLPLAITGQEQVWYEVWKDLGLTDKEIRHYFTGPAYLPWHRMQNINRWGGPLPKNWLQSQMKLQKRIVERERELGMRPVLPAFAGHVPEELKMVFPDADYKSLGEWGGFKEKYQCLFMDPMCPEFSLIQKKFIEKQTELYGTDHIYGIDIFNEVTPPSWEPEYLARVSEKVYRTLKNVDPEATWLQMGWMFYYDKNWTPERLSAYLGGAPKDKQLILDYFCERKEVWRQTESFFDTPFVWCYLGNFGGNTFLAGNMHDVDRRIENSIAESSSISGIGATLEGLDCNPYMYEFVLYKAWDGGLGLDEWVSRLADRRAPSCNEKARKAWKVLADSIYVSTSTSWQGSVLNTRPTFGNMRVRSAVKYDNDLLVESVKNLLEAGSSEYAAENPAYAFDLVNLTRQVLSNLFGELFGEFAEGCEKGEDISELPSEMLGILDDLDSLLMTNSYFLVGKWISDARACAPEGDRNEAYYYEQNARNLITTWSDSGMSLSDYANRSLSGLVSTYYEPRWTLFFGKVMDAMSKGKKFDGKMEAEYKEEAIALEKKWWDESVGTFCDKPQGDPYKMSKYLIDKYFD
ncbi:MAG: alpha-N-acetylglucosaminidase [Bacteroidales bacterium]|nr:alpha-N-acetylglucosaminidase [Bacteroidales bacterium]